MRKREDAKLEIVTLTLWKDVSRNDSVLNSKVQGPGIYH